MSFTDDQIGAMTVSELEDRLDSIQKEHKNLQIEYGLVCKELRRRRTQS